VPSPWADYGSLPFPEQIAFFKDKVHLPTQRWDDLLGAAHDRAFVVAGATKADLLADLHTAVLKGIEEGTTLETFRQDFDAIVAKRGWTGWTGEGTQGGVAWRTDVIYSTNLRTSYAAGRWAQIQEVKATRPYLMYRHSHGVVHPRPQHVAWDGLVLPTDDPFWSSHYPPNGWGCKCRAFALNDGDIRRLGKDGPDQAPVPPGDTTGIDKGWDYAPGAGINGKQIAEQTMAQWRAAKAGAWETLTRGDWQSNGRPERLPADRSGIAMGPPATSTQGAIEAVRDALGGAALTLTLLAGGWDYPVHIDAEVLGGHIAPARAPYARWIPEMISDPQEVWAMMQRHKGTGKVELRVRIIKRIDTGGKEGMFLVAQAQGGMLEAWTFIPTDDWRYLNKQRAGVLVYGR